MRITDVEGIILESPYENACPRAVKRRTGQALPAHEGQHRRGAHWLVRRRDGSARRGGCGRAPVSGAGVFEGLKSLVVGEDPFDVERLWDKISNT